jgi:hypothetical protein
MLIKQSIINDAECYIGLLDTLRYSKTEQNGFRVELEQSESSYRENRRNKVFNPTDKIDFTKKFGGT